MPNRTVKTSFLFDLLRYCFCFLCLFIAKIYRILAIVHWCAEYLVHFFSSCKTLRLKCRVVKFNTNYCKFWAFFCFSFHWIHVHMNGPYADVSMSEWFTCTLSVQEQSLVVHHEFYHNYTLLRYHHFPLKFGQLESDNKRDTYFYRCTIGSLLQVYNT